MQDDLVTVPSQDELVRRALEIRTAFDERFRAPSVLATEETIDILSVAVGDERFGLVVEQTSQILSRPRIVRVPDSDAGCLGIVGHRGKLVAVFDLVPELATSAPGSVGAVVVSRRDPTIGFAATSVLGYHRARRSAIVAPPDSRDASRVGTIVIDAPLIVVSLDEFVDRLARSEGGES